MNSADIEDNNKYSEETRHRHADIVLQDKKLKEGKGRKERKTQRDSGVIACDSLTGALICITFKSYPLSYYGAGREENSGKKINKKILST